MMTRTKRSTPEAKKKRASGPSGPTQTDAARRAAGRVRLPTIWLSAEEHRALERLRRGRSVRDTIGALLLESE